MAKKKARCPNGTYPVMIRDKGRRRRACAELTKEQMLLLKQLEEDLQKKTIKAKQIERRIKLFGWTEAITQAMKLLS